MADMRKVTATWENLEDGSPVTIEATLETSAISDLIEFFQAADGVDVYEKGDFADGAEL